MVGLDTSLLAYAVNRFAPEHPRAGRVLEDLAHGERPWALPWPAVHEFLRLVTHPHAVARPLTAADAAAFVEQILSGASVRVLGPTADHLRIANQVLASMPAPGALPPGFEVAIVLREHGVRELLSADRGMRRYRFLTVIDPVHGESWAATPRPVRRYRVLRPRVQR